MENKDWKQSIRLANLIIVTSVIVFSCEKIGYYTIKTSSISYIIYQVFHVLKMVG